MDIKVYKKYIKRIDMPYNRSMDGKIEEVSKEFVCEFKTSHVPEIGEILYIDDEGLALEVVKKIRMLNAFNEEYFVLEVIDYTGKRLNRYGSDTWWETIPLVVDIPD
jgi:hypothetical protein